MTSSFISPKRSHLSSSPTPIAMAKASQSEETSPLLTPPNANPYYFPPPPPLAYYPGEYVASPPSSTLILCLRRPRRRPCRSILSSSTTIILSFLLVLSLLSLFFLYPSDPALSVSRLDLSRLRITNSPSLSLTISIGIEVQIRNPDFFSIDYTYLNSSILYRGRWLGSVTSGGGHVRARGVSYVQADLHLDGIRVLNDVIYLIEDLASGRIPFETVTEITGNVNLFFLSVPVQGKISCSVEVNPENQSIIRQNCYPA